MATNYEVACAFVNGRNKHSLNMDASNDKLWSYGTVIAVRLNDGKFLLSDNNFSPTTSKHIGCFTSAMRYSGYYRVPVHHFGMDLCDSFETIGKRIKDDLIWFIDNKKLTQKPNRLELRRLWENAERFDKDIHKFIDDELRIKVTRTIANMKQD